MLGLKSLDIEAYQILLIHGPLTTDKLGKILNREISTAYRSLQNLVMRGIVYKETKYIESEGHYFKYTAIEPKELNQIVKKNVDEWYYQMNELAEKLDDKENSLVLRMD